MTDLFKIIESRIYESPKTYEAIRYICYEAIRYNFHSVQIFPNMIDVCKDILKDCDVKICTLGSYPHGGLSTELKVFEVLDSVKKGADEVEIVNNTRMLKSGEYDFVVNEMKAVRAAAPPEVKVKFIIENEYLSDKDIQNVCKAAIESGIDYISTSTGLYNTLDEQKHDVPIKCASEDIYRLKKYLEGSSVKIQAVGYIDNYYLAKELMDAGADRIATENAYKIIKEYEEVKGYV